MKEFSLIDLIAAHAGQAADDSLLGIGDDCALIQPAGNCQLAISTDTLNRGIHFLADSPVENLGYKSLAVSLSDLSAMGARPRWALLNLSLPRGDHHWVDEFMNGFMQLARKHGLNLVGGDTCSGPLSITVTAIGEVEVGTALTRSGAKPGDDVWVSGRPGEAAYALALLRSDQVPVASLLERLERPSPRVELGSGLRNIASACIDISDGLYADLGHLCQASACGAQLWLEQFPVSEHLKGLPTDQLWPLLLNGGDDYELCFTAGADQAEPVVRLAESLDLTLSRIGRIVESGPVVCSHMGESYEPERKGWDHFSGDEADEQ